MTSVENWGLLVDSDNLDNQVRAYIAQTVEGYLNGAYDDPEDYPPMKVQAWKDYVWGTLKEEMNKGDYSNQHLYFFGRVKMMFLTDTYLANYADVKPYVLR